MGAYRGGCVVATLETRPAPGHRRIQGHRCAAPRLPRRLKNTVFAELLKQLPPLLSLKKGSRKWERLWPIATA
jgi:hypothetical protein